MDNFLCENPNETNYHKNIHLRLEYFISSNKIPNIIFHGPAGSGKKTIVYNFLDRIYNEDRQKLKTNVMSVNCCHGKGIKFIREEVKFFSKMNIHYNHGVHFKTIVLFNADCLTIDAQSALRRCIELFSHNTRFFIVVENIHKLLNPIVSRFCEIYVPEILTNNEGDNHRFINLHTQQINNTIDELDLVHDKEKLNLIKEKINIEENGITKTPGEWIDIIDCFYENGISVLDILSYLKTIKTTLYDINSIEFNFHKIKRNYRSEKLLMFQVLWNLQI
jgi:DNA polymerase III delta prime subunit